MIHLEAAEDGFAVSLDGRCALVHSMRSPLLELGSAEPAIRQRKRGFTIRQKRLRYVKAKAWKQVAAREGFIDIEFEGLVHMTIRESSGSLGISFSRYDSSFNRFRFRLPATPGESIFGCGEQFSKLDLKGSRVPLWPDGKSAGGKWHSTYFGQPSFVTSERSWVHVGTTAYCLFDFKRPKTTMLSCWAVPEELLVGFASDAPSATGALSSAAGRQRNLPAWTWEGAWLGVQGGSAEVERKLAAAKSSGVKVGALWVQDWCGKSVASTANHPQWDWRWDRDLYPDLPADIARLRRDGIRFLGYINPFLSTEGELYAEASKAGYCVKRQDGSDYLVTATTFAAAMVDLFNPAAFAWIKGVMKREMLGIGMSGWMADFGEFLPVDAALHGGRDPLTAHNEYPVLWARANAEAVREAGKEGEAIFFLRSGWTGSAKHAQAFWAG
ncbi:MAG: alpha-glucosidase, partial [Spirochaetae bacterium HGW-Spirochaetae-7]